jgi:hypothetical protein
MAVPDISFPQVHVRPSQSLRLGYHIVEEQQASDSQTLAAVKSQDAHLFRFHGCALRPRSRSNLPRVYKRIGQDRRLRSCHKRQCLLQQISVERADVDMYRRDGQRRKAEEGTS